MILADRLTSFSQNTGKNTGVILDVILQRKQTLDKYDREKEREREREREIEIRLYSS